MKKIHLALFVLLLLQVIYAQKNKNEKIDPGLKERILEIIDSKGEMSIEEKEKMFENIKIAGGGRTKPNDKNKRNINEMSDEDSNISHKSEL